MKHLHIVIKPVRQSYCLDKLERCWRTEGYTETLWARPFQAGNCMKILINKQLDMHEVKSFILFTLCKIIVSTINWSNHSISNIVTQNGDNKWWNLHMLKYSARWSWVYFSHEIHTKYVEETNDKNLELFCLIPGNARGEFLSNWNKIPIVHLSDNIQQNQSLWGNTKGYGQRDLYKTSSLLNKLFTWAIL